MTKIIGWNSNYESSLECSESVSLKNPHDGYLREFRSALYIQRKDSTKGVLNCIGDGTARGHIELRGVQAHSFLNDDAYLLRFLRAANFNVAAAVKLVKKYQDLKADTEEILQTPFSQYKHLYEKDMFVVLKDRDEEGRKVVVLKSRNWNPDEITLDMIVVAVYHIVEEITECETTQLNGVVIIHDASEVGFIKAAKLVSQFTFKQVLRVVNFYQGGYPIKIKAIHNVSTPRIVAITYAGFKYLLKTKMRERVYLHQSGPTVLHKYFKKDILPKSLGGSCPENAVEDISILQNILRKGNDL